MLRIGICVSLVLRYFCSLCKCCVIYWSAVYCNRGLGCFLLSTCVLQTRYLLKPPLHISFITAIAFGRTLDLYFRYSFSLLQKRLVMAN
uniref:Uncharacterized protein n=1 Tax=Colobus angolensis palliatus TaxID=336983 RepID=A0A2K5HJ35_COLAP